MSNQAGAVTAPSAARRPVAWLRDLPIWTKLGLIMIVPTLATIAVGTVGLVGQVSQASAAERARSLAVLSGNVGDLVHSLQDERAIAIRLLTESDDSAAGLKDDYAGDEATVDYAYRAYQKTRATVTDLPDNLTVLLDDVDKGMTGLRDVRSSITGGNEFGPQPADDAYTNLIDTLLQVRDVYAPLSGDIDLTDQIRAAAAVAKLGEEMSRERIAVLNALAAGTYGADANRAYLVSLTGQQEAETSFRAVASADELQLYTNTLSVPATSSTLDLEYTVNTFTIGQSLTNTFTAGQWDQAMVARSDLVDLIEKRLNDEAEQSAVSLGAKVQRQVLVQTGVLLATLLLGILFAWMVARSMARSLRELRQGALAVAQYGLPQAVARLRDPALTSHQPPQVVALQIAEPLPVRSRDEFGQVTEAFNAVHLEAVRTAAEQAVLRASVATMFVNLARRSQILVDRLIGHLDQLERGEQDPDRLSELFQLDHLATRMRRNDENLLVLAGADSTRIQREPAALTDVLRAAQSEVEHYTRIEFAVVDPDIEVAAHAVNDLVHMIAELFDNATSFSAPDTLVRVEARRVGDRAVLQIVDRGIGMSSDVYAELNERLATPPLVDVAVSRMMGLVVVSRLANRHAVTVELRPSPERGTVADVVLPSGVLVPRALSGRTHAPDGFPAARSTPMAPVAAGPSSRSLFAPPLALESGPSAGSGGWPDAAPASAPPALSPTWTPAPVSSAPPAPVAPLVPTAPLMPSAPSAFAVPSAFGGPAPVVPPAPRMEAPGPVVPPPPRMEAPGYAGLGAALTASAPPAPARGLPAWADLTGAPAPSAGAAAPSAAAAPAAPPDQADLPQRRRPDPWGEPEPTAPVPRQAGPDDRWATAPVTPPYGGPSYPPAGYQPAPLPPPPPPLPPSAWPPVGTTEVPYGVSAQLDLAAPARGVQSPPPDAYSDDMTQELPIYRELESRWFTDGPALPPAVADGAGDATGPFDGVSWRSSGDDGWQAARVAADPADGGTTERGLPRRVPMAQLVPGGVDSSAAPAESRRTPEAARGFLSAYTRGVQRGRGGYDRDDDDPSSQFGGREQEA